MVGRNFREARLNTLKGKFEHVFFFFFFCLQDPFEYIDDKFYEPLPRDDNDKLRKYLGHTNVELFLEQLYEFILLQLGVKMDRNAEDFVDYSERRSVLARYDRH